MHTLLHYPLFPSLPFSSLLFSSLLFVFSGLSSPFPSNCLFSPHFPTSLSLFMCYSIFFPVSLIFAFLSCSTLLCSVPLSLSLSLSLSPPLSVCQLCIFVNSLTFPTYAQRARTIVNRAIINEDPNAKLIRGL